MRESFKIFQRLSVSICSSQYIYLVLKVHLHRNIRLAIHAQHVWQFMRTILACIACHLPSNRKVCGFWIFNATFGSLKCVKEFVTSAFGSKPLYGAFDCKKWTAQDIDIDKSKALIWQEGRTSSHNKHL